MAAFIANTEIDDQSYSNVYLPNDQDNSDEASGIAMNEKQLQRSESVDLKKWKIRRLLIPPFVSLICILLVVVLGLVDQASSRSGSSFGCDAGGNIWIDGVGSKKTASIWDIIHPLNVTLAFWRLTLTQARAIDILWDLIVGRGFQVAAGILVYKGFRILMADALIDEPLTPQEMLAIQFDTTSLSSLWIYSKGWWQKHPGRSRGCFRRLLLLTITVLYVITLPTWLQATTAYQTRLEPWIVHNNQSIWFSDLTPCALSITDGGRIHGLQHGFCVPPKSNILDAVKKYTANPNVLQCYPNGNDYTELQVTQQGLTVHYDHPTFQERVTCSLPSHFEWPPGNRIDLSAPILRLEAGSYSWFNPKSGRNHTFTGTHLIEDGMCQLRGDLYSWGFSFILLFAFALTTFILSVLWSIAIGKYHARVKPSQVDAAFEDIRTTLVVARAIQSQVGKDSETMLECDQPSASSTMHLRVTGSHVGTKFVARQTSASLDYPTTACHVHYDGDENRPHVSLTDYKGKKITAKPTSASSVKIITSYAVQSGGYHNYIRQGNGYRYASKGVRVPIGGPGGVE